MNVQCVEGYTHFSHGGLHAVTPWRRRERVEILPFKFPISSVIGTLSCKLSTLNRVISLCLVGQFVCCNVYCFLASTAKHTKHLKET